ncbi:MULTISPECIES: TetR family transcriptional regulator [Streptomyces]|uniref:TetR family transcriptional regulator n=2 Tax=Streptomyces TaxID=1883 RepID=A0A2U9P185_STRAS|nr:TetR family transcriptional regulator [Streptomyces actuosus]AWT43292.1 TetR family transcriptional regulator [Streptomyces actuosus]MBM4824547.1 TetR/AcrR family transcriptional regulator [Streptomyces actuosus]
MPDSKTTPTARATGTGTARATTPTARRSEATRAAILDAARERFATDGYERATIRAIAKDAGIDPSMVMRYYGNKEGLFAAAVSIDLRMSELPAVPRDRIGATLVAHFLTLWEENEQLTALLRVGTTNAAGAERMQDVFRDQMLPVARAACPDPEQVPARAALAATQMLGLALTRYVLRMPPVTALTRDELVAWLGPTLQRYLTAPHSAWPED